MYRKFTILVLAAIVAVPLVHADIETNDGLTGYARPGVTELASIGLQGSEANNHSDYRGSLNADGRFITFASAASNLVPNDTNDAWDVFVRDRETGEMERVSVATDGSEADGCHSAIFPTCSLFPVISADGRYVAFASSAPNLVPGPANILDFFVHDRETRTTEKVSVSSDGTPAFGNWDVPAISADGRYVAFSSPSPDLVENDANGNNDIFVHDREDRTTERVSISSYGMEANHHSWSPVISADGRYVAFESTASNLVLGDLKGPGLQADVYVHDRLTKTTELVSIDSDGRQGIGTSAGTSISADGQYIAFHSFAENLVPTDTNDAFDVFIHDRSTRITERVSVASDGTEGNSHSSSTGLSADGRYVVFRSVSSNFDPEDSNGVSDVFVHDRKTAATQRMSLASDGTETDRASSAPGISANGRYVGFQSIDSNLVPMITNEAWDTFVRDRGVATGIGGLTLENDLTELTVSGWATFSGSVVASADDSGSDGAPGADQIGTDISGASIVHRPEQEDLLLRLRLSSPPPPLTAAAPKVVYSWGFTQDETTYEVRAHRHADTVSVSSAADTSFSMYECVTSCTLIAELAGGIGTTGTDVRVSVPLSLIGGGSPTTLSGVKAWTTLKSDGGGISPVNQDDIELPDAIIIPPNFEIGISNASNDVVYSGSPTLGEGTFSGTISVSSLPPGEYTVWATACLGETCGTESVHVTL